jgi:hypothetical protein
MTGRLATQIRVRPCNEGFAYASIVVDGWSVTGIAVRLDDDGARVDWPMRDGKAGAKWAIVSPPPHQREQIEQEIIEAARGAIGRSGRR